MKFIQIWIALAVLLFTSCSNQINNVRTENVNIYGNCDMCKTAIEEAGNVKNIVEVAWSKETKVAKITYDTTKTNPGEILKRIALAGYDSDLYHAPDDAYDNLPVCCQYERVKDTEIVEMGTIEDHSEHSTSEIPEKTSETKVKENQLKAIFDKYFALKDALVESNGILAAEKANKLLSTMREIKMERLATEEHTVWMKVRNDLISDTERIKGSVDIGVQRDHFDTLSDNLYQLLNVTKLETTIYFQHCPMANEGKGANWLSKESAIRNPYYGSEMLTCGKTVETVGK